jgi:diadenylate cyclase
MNTRLGEDLGTRHRAAVGVTEESDAVVLVVSEERREISLCCRGSILRNQGRQLRPLILDLLSGKLTELPGSEKLVNGDDSVSPILPEDAETAHATQANPATS